MNPFEEIEARKVGSVVSKFVLVGADDADHDVTFEPTAYHYVLKPGAELHLTTWTRCEGAEFLVRLCNGAFVVWTNSREVCWTELRDKDGIELEI